MKILALDMATVTGWAHSNGQSGTWDLSILRDESSGMRLLRFEGKIREVVQTCGVDCIAFETVAAMAGPFINMDGVKLISKLQAIVERLCEELDGLECIGVNPSTIKAHAKKICGCKGNKTAMLEAAKKKWNSTVIVDDNQADALFLLDYTEKRFGAFLA